MFKTRMIDPCCVDQPPRVDVVGRIVVPALGLLLVTLLVYVPVYQGQRLWDDDDLIFKNPHVISGDGLYTIWFTTELDDYFPLTYTLYWFEWRLWRENVVGYHVVNVLLHWASALVIWRILSRLRIPGAYLASVLFAIHPVCVASVGWIAEGKNTLSLLGYTATIWTYLRFEANLRKGWYLAALGLFLTAMLAKSSVVMLPVVLLLLAWWQRGRVSQRDLLRSLPFFGIALVLGLATVYFQHQNAIRGDNPRPEGAITRLATTGWIVWFYLWKDLVPTRLAMIYPRWDVRPTEALHWLPLVGLLTVFSIAWAQRGSWGKPLFMALAYFVVVLFPVLGLVSMAFHGHSLVSDHLQYLAIIAPMTLVAAGISGGFTQRHLTPEWGRGLSVAVALALAVLTWRQADRFSSPCKLWGHCLTINDNSYAAHLNYGVAVGAEGHVQRSLDHLVRGIRLNPHVPRYRQRVESFIMQMGWSREVMLDFRESVKQKTDW